MEKIKSVLHGGKKSEDATHDAQTSSTGTHSGAHQDDTTHPIYDQMTGKETTHPTATGTTTSAGQTGTTGLTQGEHRGTEGPLGSHSTSAGQTASTGLGHTDTATAGPHATGSHSATVGDGSRPGAGYDGVSSASIKSGVIGFGQTGNAQEHAALSPSGQNPEAQLDRNQIVGGGVLSSGGNSATGPTAASTSHKDGLPLPVTSNQPHSNTSNIGALGNTRQESYTKDTDRSFPLAGGVASKHDPSATHPTEHHSSATQYPTQQTSSIHHTAPLAGGIASKHDPSSAHPVEQHGLTSSTHHPVTSEREPGTKEKGAGVHEGHGREGLAGAAAAATALGVASHSHNKDSQPQGHATQPLGSSTTGPTSSSTTHPTTGPHPDALAAATVAAARSSNTHGTGVGAQDSSLSGTTQPHGTGALAGERPSGNRSASHRHVPGEFPSPTPDESATFLYYQDNVVPEPGATSAGTATSTAGPHTSDALNKADPRVDSDLDGFRAMKGGSTSHQDFGATGAAPLASGAGQHELRHTGSLDQPQSRSEDHHYGRDAAVAGGLAAGAGGLAYGAHQKRDASDAHGNILPQEPSPYSSKQLDPRVSGGKAPLEQQRFDPLAKTEPHHALQTSNPAGVASSTQGPHGGLTGNETSSRQADPQSHHGRDAALLAGGAGTAAGIHHATKGDRHGDVVGSNTSTGPHTTAGSHTTGIPNQSTSTKYEEPQSHHGRDAALLGGGAATAAGIHHATKGDRHGDAMGSNTSTVPHTGAAPQTTAGPHTTNIQNQPTATKYEEPQSHHGRDAALLGGGAATAAGIHHATKGDRHGEPVGNTSAVPHTTAGPQATSGAHTADISNHPTATKHEESQSHHGRDAALLGGGAATAAGVHHATKKDHPSDTVENGKSTTGPHKSSLLNKLDPRVKDKPETSKTAGTTEATKHEEPHSHHGRDAALIGGGAATAAGAHKASQRDNLSRNDTPGTGTYVLPQQSSAAPHQGSNTSAPLAASTMSGSDHSSKLIDPSTGKNAGGHKTYSGPLTTDGTPFYGTVGAPAPIADNKSHQHGKPELMSDTRDQDKDHHYGRNAGLAGAGAATAGGLAYGAHHDKKSDAIPTGSATGPHSSTAANVADPRVQSDPTHHGVGSTTAPTGTHQSDTLNRADPTVDSKAGHKDHHLGRDAALVGGAGAAGYGAHQAAQAYGDHRSTQPGASMNEQRYDTTATGASTANPVPASGHYDYNDQTTSRNAGLGSGNTQHGDHTGRNVGLGGAALGAGALGGAAYAGHKHDNAQHAPGASNQPLASSQPAHDTFGQRAHDPSVSSYPQQGTIAPQNTQTSGPGVAHNRYDSIQDPHHKDDHTKRDAALMGTAGAATAGGAAYGYSQHQDKKEQERLEKEQHKLDKQHAKEEKAAHKHEKEHDKEPTETGEKKHGILSFLHRDKTKKEHKNSADTSPRHSGEVRRSSDGLRHSSDDPDSPRWKAKSKLHKTPPVGHPAREAGEHHEMGEMGGKREHVGIDGPIGDQARISGMGGSGVRELGDVLGGGHTSAGGEGYRGVDQGGVGHTASGTHGTHGTHGAGGL